MEKVGYFLVILIFLMAALALCTIQFHADEINSFLSISARSKRIAYFVKNLTKLNIRSAIAIDRVKIFKLTKNNSAHFKRSNNFFT